MTLAQLIKLRTNDGLDIVDFLLEVMQDRYSDFRICHRLQAAKLLNTYGNEDSPNFIDDNPREPRSDRNGRRPSRPTKFDTELARVIREDTNDGRSIVRFLVNAMVGEFRSFRPHHRMAAARELLDRGFGKSARTHQTVHPEPVEGPTPTNRHSRERTACPALDAGSLRTPIRGGNPRSGSPLGNPGAGEALTPHSSPLTPGESTDLLDDIDCGRCHCLIDIDDIDATPDTPNHPRKLDKNHHTHHT